MKNTAKQNYQLKECLVHRWKKHGHGQKVIKTKMLLRISPTGQHAKNKRGETFIFDEADGVFKHIAIVNSGLWEEYQSLSSKYFLKTGNAFKPNGGNIQEILQEAKDAIKNLNGNPSQHQPLKSPIICR